eukprot:4441335-Pyramimonas_sp.AAC.1
MSPRRFGQSKAARAGRDVGRAYWSTFVFHSNGHQVWIAGVCLLALEAEYASHSMNLRTKGLKYWKKGPWRAGG